MPKPPQGLSERRQTYFWGKIAQGWAVEGGRKRQGCFLTTSGRRLGWSLPKKVEASGWLGPRGGCKALGEARWLLTLVTPVRMWPHPTRGSCGSSFSGFFVSPLWHIFTCPLSLSLSEWRSQALGVRLPGVPCLPSSPDCSVQWT